MSVTPNTTYVYRVFASNGFGISTFSNEASATTPDVPPAAPNNLTAFLETTTQVSLSWADNASNETGFTVERCTGAGCTNFALLTSVAADVTTYSDTTVSANTTYVYRVFAFNGAGNSAFSNEVTISTTPPPTPGLYFSTVGTDAIPGVVGPYDDADIYTWNGTTFGRLFDATVAGLLTGANIDGLVISDANHFYVSFSADTGLTGLGTVQDEDVAFYNNGIWSVYFDGTPLGLTAAGQDLDAISIVNGILYFSTTGGSSIPGVAGPYDDADIYTWNGTSFGRLFDASVAGLPGNANVDGLFVVDSTHFYLSLSATDTTVPVLGNVQDEDVVYSNNGVWSVFFDGTSLGLINGGHDLDAITVGVILVPPAAPTNLVALLDANTQVSLSWTDNANNETGFTVERCTGAGCTNFVSVTTVGNNATTFSDTTVSPNTVYVYRVYAINADGNSPVSNEATITTSPPSTPAIYFSTVGTDAIPGVLGPYDDADIYTWNGTTFGRLFDASVAGLLTGANVDGLVISDANHFYVSFSADTSLPGLGIVQDEDVAFYNSGVWSVYFDGTALGLIAAGHDLDAISIVNGILYFSTSGSSAIPGVTGPYDDADIYTWNGAVFGLAFDASVAGLPGNANVDGLVFVDSTHFYISFAATDTTVPGPGNVQDEDVVYYNNGVWSVYFDGTAFGLTNAGQDLDAFDLP
jgi:hypothetical protein